MSNKFSEQISKMSFEQALSELEKIVSKLESGNESLENAINDYAYGDALRKFCEEKLAEAKMKIEKITQDSDGKIITTEVEID
jgi:exodeoxyribonuclease VII small subunit